MIDLDLCVPSEDPGFVQHMHAIEIRYLIFAKNESSTHSTHGFSESIFHAWSDSSPYTS